MGLVDLERQAYPLGLGQLLLALRGAVQGRWMGPPPPVHGNGHAPAAKDDAPPVAATGVALDFDPSATSISDPNARSETNGAGAPESFVELQLDDVRGIIWDDVTPLPAAKRHEPSRRELEVLEALWSRHCAFTA